jgi:hypothetical protein
MRHLRVQLIRFLEQLVRGVALGLGYLACPQLVVRVRNADAHDERQQQSASQPH